MRLDRRTFLALAGGGAAAATLAHGGAPPARALETKARIVIVGAGAAGLATANRLAGALDGATITLIDARKAHYYQPGYTLVAAGLKGADYPVSETADWIPRGVTWIEEAAVEIDPEARSVTTASGTKVAYDFLVVAAGLKLDFDAIEGFSLDLVGKDGVGAVYAGPEYAWKTWQALDRFTSEGGRAVLFRPATEMKCAGAPLKYTFLTDDHARRKGNRDKVEITYAAHSGELFSVPIVHEKMRMLFGERNIPWVKSHVMRAIDPGRKIITFMTPDGPVEMPYDFTNVIPPMRAPDVVRNSPLPWEDKWTDQGYVAVDKHTMRHVRYPEVFAVGDVAGVPKGKTAASVKWQVPVAVDHLAATIAGRESTETYNGYTSCPLITRIGRAMLIEFDYDNNLVPSFPGVIAPLEELWTSWLMKEIALKPTYNAMLRGRA